DRRAPDGSDGVPASADRSQFLRRQPLRRQNKKGQNTPGRRRDAPSPAASAGTGRRRTRTPRFGRRA
ncbi:MAG: hypothetical protein R5N69_09870, partial [Cutibacterium granulosum]